MHIAKNTDQLRKEIGEHLDADRIRKGTYWNEEEQLGCFIGCLTHSDYPTPAVERFGFPEPLLRICEAIFENMTYDYGRAFFHAFGRVVQDGADLSRVHWNFLAKMLRRLPSTHAVDGAIVGMQLLASGESWLDARDYARNGRFNGAVYHGAVYHAAHAAISDLHAWPARCGEEAGLAVNAAQRRSGANIAIEAHWQRDTLLRLIAEAPTHTGEPT